MLVFDLTDLSTFRELDYWVGELDFRLEKNDLTVIVVGNKADKPQQKVCKAELDSWIKRHASLHYIEVSATTGSNVDRAFELAAETLLKRPGKK